LQVSITGDAPPTQLASTAASTPHQHARVDLDLQEAHHGTHIRGILAAHAEEMETAARRRSRPGGACRAVETVRGIEESRRDEKEDCNYKNDENGS